MQMPYAAMVTALVLYTATHISEIVRGSIQAVHKGQVEASEALALSGFQRYRFVILPAGDANRVPAADQPVPQLLEELVAGRC